jgi:S1-C subfamily serine protease
VVKDSPAGQLGLRGGDRLGIVDGKQVVVGGDILLSVQGIAVATESDMVKALNTLEKLKPGEELRVTVLRDERVVQLTTKWKGR